MAEDTAGTTESLKPRPREVIESDLQKLEDEAHICLEKLVIQRKGIEELPKDKQDSARNLLSRFSAEEEVKEEELEKMFAGKVPLFIHELRGTIGVLNSLSHQVERLEEEMTPYRKADSEKLIYDLSSRVSFDAIFDYYQDRSFGQGGGDDLLVNTVRELLWLRRFQYEQTRGASQEHDFNYYEFVCGSLERFKRKGEEKGFLLAKPKEGFQVNTEFGQKIKARRKKFVRNLKDVLEQVDSFNILSRTYRPYLDRTRFYDDKLLAIQSAFDLESGGVAADLIAVDCDPNLIMAAKRHANEIIEGYKRIGRLPRSKKSTKAERQRINSIDIEKEARKINFVGFEPPEGMEAVVTVEEIFSEIKATLPPDFIRQLRSVSYKERPVSDDNPKDSGDKPKDRVTGSILTEYNKSFILTATDIEIYEDLFVPKSAETLSRLFLRACFMNALWHEIGHNAQYLMDYSEMADWERVMEEDQTPVTLYVEQSRKKDPVQGKREDFAESFSMFILNPALLSILSLERLSFMWKYFRYRLSEDQLQTHFADYSNRCLVAHRVWVANSFTPEKIRDLYLSAGSEHEDI